MMTQPIQTTERQLTRGPDTLWCLLERIWPWPGKIEL